MKWRLYEAWYGALIFSFHQQQIYIQGASLPLFCYWIQLSIFFILQIGLFQVSAEYICTVKRKQILEAHYNRNTDIVSLVPEGHWYCLILFPLRARMSLLLYKVYGISALLVLSWRYTCIIGWELEGQYCCTKSMALVPFWFLADYISSVESQKVANAVQSIW